MKEWIAAVIFLSLRVVYSALKYLSFILNLMIPIVLMTALRVIATHYAVNELENLILNAVHAICIRVSFKRA